MNDNKMAINYSEIAQKITSEHKLIHCAGDFYEYNSGSYHKLDIQRIYKYIKNMLKNKYRLFKGNEVVHALGVDTFINLEKLNDTPYLNLKNGMVNLSDFKLYKHSPDFYSTIQLDINYNSESKCEKWLKTLDEIFQGDSQKIITIQEYFGLCLTNEVKYEKALILIGEGANGKSVILYILQGLLGMKNYSAIPLEKFNDMHYIANLFNKLANISIETNAKSTVYDSVFKAVISGDPITADPKFKHPFTFRPFCKLVFALNNMPRVDDKTAAFFRRLLIIRFNREFKEIEQNKNLKFELLAERDGIFNWCLEGLKRLRERGYFATFEEMDKEIQEYRKENNNVLLFVEDKCEINIDYKIAKDELYACFEEWCKKSGLRPLSKIKFGKELAKQFSSVNDDRDANDRLWAGVGLKCNSYV